METYKVFTRFCTNKKKIAAVVFKSETECCHKHIHNVNPSVMAHTLQKMTHRDTSKLKLTDNWRDILSGGVLEELAVGWLVLCNIAI